MSRDETKFKKPWSAIASKWDNINQDVTFYRVLKTMVDNNYLMHEIDGYDFKYIVDKVYQIRNRYQEVIVKYEYKYHIRMTYILVKNEPKDSIKLKYQIMSMKMGETIEEMDSRIEFQLKKLQQMSYASPVEAYGTYWGDRVEASNKAFPWLK